MKNKVLVLSIIIGIMLFICGCQMDLNQISNEFTPEACKAAGTAAQDLKIISDEGVIRYISLEGGFYGIVGTNGNYDPVNLPKAFMQDGRRVKFTAFALEGVASIHMWGTLISLISMRTIDSGKKLVMDAGVVHQKLIQGRPWVIEATAGTYQPINLPGEFQVENLSVRFTGTIRSDIIIVPGLWPILDIYEIKKVDPNPVIVRLGEEFSLPVGKSAVVPPNEVFLTFKAVLSDSRCPIGVNCVWQGEAIILVNVKIGSVDYGDFKMTTLNDPSIIKVDKYYFQLIKLDPYPVYNVPVDPASYVGSFIIGLL